MKSEQNQVSL